MVDRNVYGMCLSQNFASKTPPNFVTTTTNNKENNNKTNTSICICITSCYLLVINDFHFTCCAFPSCHLIYNEHM